MSLSSTDFRWAAKKSLARAQEEMAEGSDTRLRYAALELRLTLEALVYSRALSFKDDIPPDQHKNWPAQKVMALLLQIDPTVELETSYAFGLQPDAGTPAPPEAMKSMGTDIPVSLKDVQTHYHALGQFLHMPYLAQIAADDLPDLNKLRKHCDAVIAITEKVLSSKVWGSINRIGALPECLNEACKQPIKRRLPSNRTEVSTNCFACNAEYTVKYGSGDQMVEWIPKQEPVNCLTPECTGIMNLWPHEIRPGTWWTCKQCGVANEIVLSLNIRHPPNQATE